MSNSVIESPDIWFVYVAENADRYIDQNNKINFLIGACHYAMKKYDETNNIEWQVKAHLIQSSIHNFSR